MSESRLNILKSLHEAQKSTKALLDDCPQFRDRAELSAYLGNLFRAGLIKKQSNGYWKLLNKGEALLRELSSGTPDQGNEPAEASQIAKPSVQSSASDAVPAVAATTQPQDKSAPNDAKGWSLIKALQDGMSKNEKLIIEGGHTFFVIAGCRFSVGCEDDLSAAIRMAGMYAGDGQ